MYSSNYFCTATRNLVYCHFRLVIAVRGVLIQYLRVNVNAEAVVLSAKWFIELQR